MANENTPDKTYMTLLIVVLLCAMAVLSTYFSSIATLYQTLSGALLGTLGIHHVGNVSAEYLSGKNDVGMAQATGVAPEAPLDPDALSDSPYVGPPHSGPSVGDSAGEA